VVCTEDSLILETEAPLGSDFEPGAEYAVNVSDNASVPFVARQSRQQRLQSIKNGMAVASWGLRPP
jgi:hypothetical protein